MTEAAPAERLLWTGRPGASRLWHRPELSGAERARLLGTAACSHEADVIAGDTTRTSFTITSPAGGLHAGDRLRIAWRWPFDWRLPDGGAAAQATVDRAPAAVHIVRSGRDFDPWQHHLDIELDGPIAAGQSLCVVPGGDGWYAPTAACADVDFIVALWQPRDPRWMLVGTTTAPRVVAGAAVRVVAVSGGDAVVGDEAAMHVRAEDRWGNTTRLPAPVRVTGDGTAAEPESCESGTSAIEVVETTGGEAEGVVVRCRFVEPGLFRPWIDVDGLPGTACSPIEVHDQAPPLRLFFGDLHSGQTDVGCGGGSLKSHFASARAAGLQFASQQANDHYITQARWASIRQDSRAADRPNRFVAFLGCEWSPPTVDGGDRNVIYRDDEPRMRRSGRHFGEIDEDPEADVMTAPAFHDAFRDESVLCNLHVGGRPTNLAWHEPSIEPLFEVHSTHATSEWFIEEALERGYRIGITGGADGVYGRPGADHPGWRQNRNVRSGLTGVWAVSLDKEGLWEAFHARRCYGTTGERIGLRVAAWPGVDDGDGASGGVPMGGVLQTTRSAMTLRARVAGTAAIERIDVLRCAAAAGNGGVGSVREGPRRPIEVMERFDLAPPDAGGRLRVQWMGSEARGTAAAQRVVWDGELRLSVGRVTSVEAVNVQSAADGVEIVDDGRCLRWRSSTAGNRAGVEFDVAGPEEAELSFVTGPSQWTATLAQVRAGMAVDAGGLSRRVETGPAPDRGAPADVTVTATVAVEPGEQSVWVRVVQVDGAMAWASPVTVVRAT